MFRSVFVALSFLAASIFSASVLADQPFNVKFTKEFTNSSDPMVREVSNSERLRELADLVNELFILEQELTVIFGAEDGPLFDPELSEIWMPASFIADIENRFEKRMDPEDAPEVQDIVIDVLQHTLMHELAHALVAQFELPVLGREEDAADGLGSVFLIEYLQDGQTVVLSAADMFALESEDRDSLDESDFWGEHSLDLQRYYTTLCHVYGSEPEAYEELLEEDGLGEERAEQCEYEYEKLVVDWLKVLEPYMEQQ